jgi:hypothetical protein
MVRGVVGAALLHENPTRRDKPDTGILYDFNLFILKYQAPLPHGWYDSAFTLPVFISGLRSLKKSLWSVFLTSQCELSFTDVEESLNKRSFLRD